MPDPSPKNLLLFAYYYRPSMASGVQRISRFARYLPEFGYTPHVICSSSPGVTDEKNVVYTPNPDTERKAGRASRLAARIQRAVLPYNEELPWVPHAVAAAGELIARMPVAAMISSSPPLASHLAAAVLRRRHGLKWLADFRDPLLGNPGRGRGWARPYDAFLDRRILTSCDAALATTDVIAADWTKRYPSLAAKFHPLWNGFDPCDEAVKPAPIPASGHRVLLHSGVVYTFRHPLWLASSMERLIASGRLSPASVRLRMTGELQADDVFAAHPAVSALVARGCLEYNNARIPRAEALREISEADYLLILDIPSLANVGYAVPAKLYDCILMGRPLLAITPRSSPVCRILANCGVPNAVVHPDSTEEEIDRKLLDFFALPSTPTKPSEWFLETFDGRRQARQVASYLDEITAC